MDSQRSHECPTSLTPVLDKLSTLLGKLDCFLFLVALLFQCAFLVCVLKQGAPNFKSRWVRDALVFCHQFFYSVAEVLAVAISSIIFFLIFLLQPGLDSAHWQREPIVYVTNNLSIRQTFTHLTNEVEVWINVIVENAIFQPFEFPPLVFDPHLYQKPWGKRTFSGTSKKMKKVGKFVFHQPSFWSRTEKCVNQSSLNHQGGFLVALFTGSSRNRSKGE